MSECVGCVGDYLYDHAAWCERVGVDPMLCSCHGTEQFVHDVLCDVTGTFARRAMPDRCDHHYAQKHSDPARGGWEL